MTVDPDVVPITVTQLPGESDDTVKEAVLENRVEEVQSTVSCPDVGFCTSMDVPEMVATEPDVPGTDPPRLPVEPVGDAGAVVELVAVFADPPPHAATATVRATASVGSNTD